MFRRILVAIDIEHERSWARALPEGAHLAGCHGAELHVVHVVPPYESSLVGSFFPEDHERRVIEEAKRVLARIASEADLGGVEPHLHVAHGSVYEEILRAADTLGADLIVLHAYRPGRKDFLLGPNAARVVRHASQSVLVFRD